MILFTGGSGRLGKALQPHFPADLFVGSRAMDIRNPQTIKQVFDAVRPNLIVHLAAVVGEVKCQYDVQHAWSVNVNGTRSLLEQQVPMLYASTVHVFDGATGNYSEKSEPNPIGVYALTKREAENLVLAWKMKLIRFCFRERPFPYKHAGIDVFTSAMYLDDFALEFKRAIELYEKLPSITHLGGPRLSAYEMAKQSVPDVGKTTHADLEKQHGHFIPQDVSVDTSLWKSLTGFN